MMKRVDSGVVGGGFDGAATDIASSGTVAG